MSVEVAKYSAVFNQYSSGIITDTKCGDNPDHDVLAVGYGKEGSTGYFIIKNSWGSGWGEGGFGKIAMSDGPGICAINTHAW